LIKEIGFIFGSLIGNSYWLKVCDLGVLLVRHYCFCLWVQRRNFVEILLLSVYGLLKKKKKIVLRYRICPS